VPHSPIIAPELTLLPWSSPLSQAASRWLADSADWVGEGPLALEGRLVIVPTRQSGRRLREALAIMAAEKNQAVFPPRVIVPEMLPGVVATVVPTASRLEMTLAWAEVLLMMNLRSFQAVIPTAPPERNFEWALALAKRLVKVQSALSEGGLRMADVVEVEGIPERERWRQLTQLESAVDRSLSKQNLTVRVEAERRAEAGATIPEGITEVILIGAPDVLPVAIRYLERLQSQVRIRVLVYGADEKSLAHAFDKWGQPRATYWASKPIELADFNYQVGLCSDPGDQAKEISALAAMHPEPDEWLAVALGDPEIGPPLEHALQARGISPFTPEGKAWRQSALFGVVTGLTALVDAPTCEAIGELLRCPDLLDWGGKEIDSFAADTLLRQWDSLRADHLVSDLMTAKRHCHKRPLLGKVLDQLIDWRAILLTSDFGSSAREILAEIYQHKTFATGSIEANGAEHWLDCVEAVQRASVLLPDMGVGEMWALARQSFGDGVWFENKVSGAVELGGWLELLWADSAQVVIAGCNDGLIPEAMLGDAFLPEGLRVKLGLKSNAERLARDAYIMAATIGLRPDRQSVRILVGKVSMSGEPLRPSRLLMNGTGERLPDRVRHLFKEIGTTNARVPWRRAWQLSPRFKSPQSTVSVTALRDWLACPFRYYLTRVLGMRAQDIAKVELDAMDFGSLVHLALEKVTLDPGLSDCGDAEMLRTGLWSALENEVAERWGKDLSLPLVIQLESARQRLKQAAQVLAAEWRDGWRIERIEWEFQIPVGGLLVKGKIDRIDRHQDGRIRVVDYKTSDKPVAPIDAHLGSVRATDLDRPDWLRVMVNNKEKRWIDLQLPLYRRALVEEYGPDIDCLYFNLPKAIGETGLVSWPPDTPELQTAAELCAEQVAAAILAAEFWPPVESLGRRDEDWMGVFHNGVMASVNESWIQEGGRDA
jgi:ATP-dependent helicase/nuclease subunit B